MFGFGSKTIVGLDVGSSSIKAVELKNGRGPELKWRTWAWNRWLQISWSIR